LNVASTAAFQPGPLMAVYYATKAYVLSFSEALANELQDTGVTVTALCPGPTETNFQAAAQMEESKLFSRLAVMDSATVARLGYEGLMSGKSVVIPGARNRLLARAVRLLPRGYVTKVVRSIQDRKSAA
jgi:short-subunit dehydrogenase